MEQYSWNQLSETKIVKTIDYSVFKGRSSGIPQAFYEFFDINPEEKNDKYITLLNNGNEFDAVIKWKRIKTTASMFWGEELSELIKHNFPNWKTLKPHDKSSQMKLIFSKTKKSDVFRVSFKDVLPKVSLGEKSGDANTQKFDGFEKDKFYKRSELHDMYGGNRQRGISNCADNNLLFIFTNPHKGQDVYVDKWEGDSFFYSGEGRLGDMTFTGGNLSIKNHEANGKEIHLFEADKNTKNRGYWRYVDQVRLVDVNYYRNLDDNGNERQSFQFVLVSVSNAKISHSLDDIASDEAGTPSKPNETERRGLVTSRVGQGYYRNQILSRWGSKCAVTGLSITTVLIASHIHPWKDATDEERLDVGNGILLSPNLDALFDKHLISFEDNGSILISELLNESERNVLGIAGLSLSMVYDDMTQYLALHRVVFYEKQNLRA